MCDLIFVGYPSIEYPHFYFEEMLYVHLNSKYFQIVGFKIENSTAEYLIFLLVTAVNWELELLAEHFFH